MKRYLILFCVLATSVLCFTREGKAQNIQAEAKLDTPSISLGDQTAVHISVHSPRGEAITFPPLSDTITSKIQIVSSTTDTVQEKNKAETITRNLVITSFDPGYYTIPPFVINTRNGTVTTNALQLQVLHVKVDTTKAIYDIKQPLAVSYSWLDWLRDHWLWIVIPVLVVLLITGLVYYLKRKPRKASVIKTEVKQVAPPHTIALEKLYELRERKLWQSDQVKLYYSELTDIIREYLEMRYGIKALEQTTEDILASLRRIDISEGNRELLYQMLELADLVKFAKQKPLAAENEMSMEIAINFVNGTRPVEPLPGNKEERMNNGNV